MEQGLIQVYTGEGKGKTTAALGLAVRALGQGLRVLLVRFLKTDDPASGEVLLLRKLDGIEIVTAGVGGIRSRARDELRASSERAFAEMRARLAEKSFDLVILDEINGVLHRGYLPPADVLAFLDRRPAGTELILTGRNASPEILERADLVSRIEAVRHPLQRGVVARKGIEF